MRTGLAVLGAALLLAGPAAASEQHPTLIGLEGEIMCPTCHTTLDQSNSPAAKQIEGFISRRIAAGDTTSEIKAKLVANYGTAILAAPPRHGFSVLAWLLPLVGVVGGAAALAALAWRWTRGRDQAPEPVLAGIPVLEPELERRLDDELRRF